MLVRLFLIALGGSALLGVGAYFVLHPTDRKVERPVWDVPGGDGLRGRKAVGRYGCPACHVIPGVPGASGRVGPKLLELDEQIYVGGVLPNAPEQLVRWIQNPKEFSPETAMPELGVTAEDARDIAAHLYAPSKERFTFWNRRSP
jgi:cytochrome c